MYLINKDGRLSEKMFNLGYTIWSVDRHKIFGITFYLLKYHK